MATSPNVSVRLDEATMDRLEREAREDRRPKASLARLILTDVLRDRERQVARVGGEAPQWDMSF